LTDATAVSSASADLLRGEAEHLSQDEDRALRGRKVLERGDERELDALALLVACLGLTGAALGREKVIRVGLEPDGLDDGICRRHARVRGRSVVDRQHTLRAQLDRAEARVRRDPVEPCAQRSSTFEPVQATPGAQQRLLKRVLGIVHRAEHPVAVRVELARCGSTTSAYARSSPLRAACSSWGWGIV
jgi:hypothetical protein